MEALRLTDDIYENSSSVYNAAKPAARSHPVNRRVRGQLQPVAALN